MKLIYNRFALIPFHCTDCHRYIWLEPYRKAEVYQIMPPNVSPFTKKKICSDCLPKYDICHAIKRCGLEDRSKLIEAYTKNVKERKVGKWICVHHIENKITYDSWKCSECQHDFNSEEESMVDFDEYKFCPNCGAEMVGAENE